MKMTVWMVQNRSGDFLCMGNGNKDMSYHFSYPYDCEYMRSEDYVMCRTKHEVKEHIRKWHCESSPYKIARRWRCHPVRMVVSWEHVKTTKKEKDNGK